MIGIMAFSLTTTGCSLWNKTFHKKKAPVAATGKVAADSTKKTASSLKPYKSVINGNVKTTKGFFSIHKKDDKYYFEVPVKMFNRDILIVNRISKASADMRNGASGYAGDQIGEAVFRFEEGPSNKLFMRRISFSEYSPDSTKSMFASVQKNNVQAIAQAFPVLAKSTDSSAVVVDATDFLNSDNDILYFQRKGFKDRAGMGAQQNDRSYIEYVRAFENNVEVKAVKTYNAGMNPAGNNYTVELNSSLVLLPEKPMRARLMDPRVGYFATGFKDFDVNPQGVEMTIYAKRWRLEPRPEDVDKYMRGELVEPAKPIVFYIDPATPKKWIPYLQQGVNDWQKAFEKAGFKNAIYALEAPAASDSTWSIDDATHSAIIYRPSVIANAMGPSVADPRSGEILESHVFWYHNIMSLLKNWYMLQAGLSDKRAQVPQFSDELMGKLIRFVSSHEVGHTLGLRHNFGSSSTVPVEKLRDKKWVEAHGHTPSIMDYARFNYVAQPEDNIGEAGLFPRIGDYDIWAIEWGYRWYPQYKTPEEEQKVLLKTVTDRIKADRRLWFGGETEPFDPRCQSEDLGDDAVKAGTYGIKNLKRIVPQLQRWVNMPDKDYEPLLDAYKDLLGQYSLYLGHALKNVGGMNNDYKLATEKGAIYSPTPYAKQKAALKFIGDNLFTTPTWLNNPDIMNKFKSSFAVALGDLDRTFINSLVSKTRMSVMWSAEHDGRSTAKIYTVDNMLNDMDASIFSEAHKGTKVDFYKRNLQNLYVYRLLEEAFAVADPNVILGDITYHFYASDLPTLLKERLRSQVLMLRKAANTGGADKITKLHYRNLADIIERSFRKETAIQASGK